MSLQVLKAKSCLVSIFSIIVFGTCHYVAVAQKTIYAEQFHVVFFSEIYKSSLVDMSANYYDFTYLLTSEKPIKTQVLLCALSKKTYNSERDIIDTLCRYYKVYKIARNVTDDLLSTTIENLIFNRNNYKEGYLFPLSEEVRRYGSVSSFILQFFSPVNKTISYKILPGKTRLNTLDIESVVINSITN